MNFIKSFLYIIFPLLFLQSCNTVDKKAKIMEKGKLTAITGYNAYSYFIYKGEPRGFEYDLVKKLAEHFNVELELKVVNNINTMFDMLNNGEGDLIAFNLTVTKERKEKVDFTETINTTKQVLVQRKPDKWYEMTLDDIEKQMIRDPADLIGKKIVVRNSSAYIERLLNLSEEIGGDIEIVSGDPDWTIEDLIEMVADGQIDFTVSDENIAKLNAAYHRNIDVKTEISLSQRIAWAVQKDNEDFVEDVNHWLDSMKRTTDFAVIYKKYFVNRYAYKKRVSSEFFSNSGGGISKYDSTIKMYSEKIGWDWRLAASLIYQESQFDPKAKSWVGATGLMQLMKRTGKQFGADNLENPSQNLKAGFGYLSYLDNLWKETITDSLERIKFVLASYNIGQGQISDARNLAVKYNADPNKWNNNVEYYLLMKSNPKFYDDPVVNYGYANGTETVKYVKEILDRYEQYKQLIN